MSDPIISVQDITIHYDDTLALRNVSFEIFARDKVAIIGPNGAGKSTLMKAIMGLIPIVTGGIITVDRNRLGYVPQHQNIDWQFPVTVRDVVMLGLTREIGWFRLPRKKHWQTVDDALNRVSMMEFGHRQISELSGGERQRVFIARALAQQVDTILLDEPFAGVDIAAQEELLNMLDRLNNDGITILLSTHDLNMAFNRFSRVMALHHRLVAFDTPEKIYTTNTLKQLYGGVMMTIEDGEQTITFVDEDTTCC